jgi:hypothetical protein
MLKIIEQNVVVLKKCTGASFRKDLFLNGVGLLDEPCLCRSKVCSGGSRMYRAGINDQCRKDSARQACCKIISPIPNRVNSAGRTNAAFLA